MFAFTVYVSKMKNKLQGSSFFFDVFQPLEELVIHRPNSGDFLLVTAAFKSEGLFFANVFCFS